MAETAFKLRSASHETYHVMQVTAPSGGYTAGQLVAINTVVGVIVEAAALGVVVTFLYKANKIVVPATAIPTGDALLTVGAKAYYNGSGAVGSESSGTTLCGMVTLAPAIGATEVEIDLDGLLSW